MGRNHHLTSVSTSPKKTAQQNFFTVEPISAHTVKRSNSYERLVSMYVQSTYYMCLNKNLLAVATKVIYTVRTVTGNSMYKIKLVYDPEPKTQTLKESVTYCASMNLYQQHHIECYQTSASELAFEKDTDRTLALVYLTQSQSFTPRII